MLLFDWSMDNRYSPLIGQCLYTVAEGKQGYKLMNELVLTVN